MSCTNTGLTGGKFCTVGNPMGVPTGIWIAKDSFSTTAANFLLKSTWTAAVKAENIFPINGNLFKAFEDQSVATKYHDWGNQTRSAMQQKVGRFTVLVDANECQKKQLIKFRGYLGRVFIEYGNWMRGTTPDSGVNVKGARLSMINVEVGDFNTSDGKKGNVAIIFDTLTEKDFAEYDYSRDMAWDVIDIDGLTEVDLKQVGAATATSVVVSVSADCYGNSFPIEGLVKADFVISGTGSITSVTSVNGVYMFVTSGATNSTIIDLVAPAAISVADFYIKSGGAVTISGIA